MKRVVVFGGGVAGLTAAHELAERGFAVALYERRQTVIGGKARSEEAGGATGGRLPLPGEHGFRFFPGFYRHVPDTMRRIPVKGQPDGVLQNLVPAPRGMMAMTQHQPFEYLMRLPEWDSASDWNVVFAQPAHLSEVGLTLKDLLYFFGRLLDVLTKCNARRLVELDGQTWWNFLDAKHQTPAFQLFLATGLTRNAVAAQAQLANARTISGIAIQLMLNMVTAGQVADRVLTGPTTAVWLEPWRQQLIKLGVEIHQDALVTAIEFDGRRMSGAIVQEAGTFAHVIADAYVCALPLDQAAVLLPASLLAYDPTLSGLPELKKQMNWMTGIQFFLDYDAEIDPGHINCVDSAWAVTAISQKQFWPSIVLSSYGDGTTKGIISADISNWTKPADGGPVAGKRAIDCTRDEIAAETWRQLVAGLSGGGAKCPLTTFRSYWIDDSIVNPDDPNQHELVNLEPLLVNQQDSWALRPDAATHVENLVLAGDYVRTNTDFASMEAANEAGRRAVNALLPRLEYLGPRCQIWGLDEPEIFAPFRAFDMERFARGEDWVRPGQIAESILDQVADDVERMGKEVATAAEHTATFLRGLAHGPDPHAKTPQDEEIDGIFERNKHRTNPIPTGKWATYQTWQNLVFAHWPVPPSVVQAYVPKGLEIDLFDGQAYISIVSMKMAHICFRLLGTLTGTIPGETSFPELNLRTYVRCNGRRGVYFLRADAQALIADIGARLMFHMPYGPASMSLTTDAAGRSTFRSHRTTPQSPDATYAMTFTPTGALTPVVEGTRTAFLRNRDYAFLSVDGHIKSVGLLHDPWKVQTVEATVQINTVLSASGFELPSSPISFDYTPEMKVVLWGGEPVGR